MLFSLLTSVAWSFNPNTSTWIGAEPNRIVDVDPQVQSTLSKQGYWQQFLLEHPTWQARFDEYSQLPYRMWGKGIPLDSQHTVLGVQKIVDDHNLLGTQGVEIQLFSDSIDKYSNRQYIHFRQRKSLSDAVWNDLLERFEQDIPVWRRGVEARIQFRGVQGAQEPYLTQMGIDVYAFDVEEVTPIARIAASDALEVAKQALIEKHGLQLQDLPAWNQQASLIWLPLVETSIPHPKEMAVRLCWEIRWETQSPRGQWVAFVDVETAELWSIYNEVRYLEGSLFAEHDERTVGDDLVLSPLPELNLGAATVRTDLDGSYMVEGEEPIQIALDGRRARVFNQMGEEALFEVSGGEQTWIAEESILPELDQFVFQNRIYAWSSIWAPQIVNNWTRATVYVNEDDVCNAYFDGEMHFYRAGGGCNNTGRIADVAFHEWGHGFHYYNLLSGEYDGTMSEGIGDAIAFFQTWDNRISPNFGTNGSSIRDVEPNYAYPEDVVNEVHQDGLIFAGAVWDWWKLLRAEMGDTDAYDTIVPVFVQGLRGGPTLPNVFDEFIFADDDNADLSDGTPNQCSMIEAFALHGLGPNGGSGLLSLEHTPLDNQPFGTTLSIDAEIIQFAVQCTSASPETATLRFSWDNGLSWESAALDLSETAITGEIPAYLDTGIVQYFIEMTDTEGNTVSIPPDGDRHPFTLYVGDVEEIFCTDFESDDGGFTHALLAGENREGADDWAWGTPNGLGGDPETASSGSMIWGNDLGGEVNGQQYNGEYQNSKHNRLRSPNFDVADYDSVILTYDRWLTVEDGFYDQALILMDDTEIWRNHASSENVGDEHHRDRQWQNHSLLVDVTGVGSTSFAWDIVSDRGFTMGGWNIDNVCVYGIPKPVPVEEEETTWWKRRGCQSVDGNGLDLLYFVGVIGFLGMRRREG